MAAGALVAVSVLRSSLGWAYIALGIGPTRWALTWSIPVMAVLTLATQYWRIRGDEDPKALPLLITAHGLAGLAAWYRFSRRKHAQQQVG